MKTQYFQYIGIVAVACLLAAGCGAKKSTGLNEEASVQTTDELPENPLLLHALTANVQPKDSTMCILYGNDTAFNYATTHGDSHYTAGAVLYNVTWRQQPDEQWAGGNIPRKMIMVERVAFDSSAAPVYTLYTGSPLKKAAAAKTDSTHMAVITGRRVAVWP